MKHKTIGLSLLIGGGLVLAGCQSLTLTPSESTESIVTTKTMAFQATTAISLVSGLDSSTSFSAMSETSELIDESSEVIPDETPTETSDEESEETVEGDVTTPDIPVATLDLLFTNGNGFAVTQMESDREDYTNMEVISFNVMDEEAISYTLYYNTEPLEAEDDELPGEAIVDEADIEENDDLDTPTIERHGDQEDDDDDDDRDGYHHGEDKDDDEDDRHGYHHGNGENHDGYDGENYGMGQGHREHEHGKAPTKITGIAIVGEEEYTFMSKTETDNDSDEQEIESKFMIFKDEANFISIKQEIEIEGTLGSDDYEYEEEFKYSVVKDGEVVKRFKLEIENDADEQELEVKLDDVKYEVEYEYIDERVFLHIEVNGQDEVVYEKIVTIDETTNEASVEYILQ